MTWDKETLTTLGGAGALLAGAAGIEVTDTEVQGISSGLLAAVGAVTALIATVRAAFK
jgi:hypothetical protein